MKKCYKCGEEKALDEFHKNKAKADGHSNYCKVCAKVRNRAYYLATPERNEQRRASHNRAKLAARKFVAAWLHFHPCVDCGEADPLVLEFDHVRGEKLLNISDMVQRATSVATIRKEIDKCEVRCANCHRRKTRLRGNHYFPDFLDAVDFDEKDLREYALLALDIPV